MHDDLIAELVAAFAESPDYELALDVLDLDCAHSVAPTSFAGGYVEGLRAGAVASHIPDDLRDLAAVDPRRRGFAYGVFVAWMYA